MKFYYDGKLMRTSRTHYYNYGVYRITDEKCISCSGTRLGAEKALNQKLSNTRKNIKFYNDWLDGKVNKSKYDYTDEEIQRFLESSERAVKSYKIVELEARE